ncbi:MAG: fused MFS/spermidine synthase [Acidobacteria bacterium]|nr:fused MFS/spermidine synthase [Acidobacteriota bacterium]
MALLLVLFVGSGCAALIYEIVWFQLLELVIGSSAVSLGVLLGTFMGGMCLGSVALPRLVSTQPHPLRVYAALELLTGIIAVLVLFALPLAGTFYIASIDRGASSIALRAVVAALCLLPPTMLMGATLPAIARWAGGADRASRLGFLYGANIAGAVLGSLTAGFYLLRVHDMATATYVAALINLVIALIAFLMSRVKSYVPPSPSAARHRDAEARANGADRSDWPLIAAISLSGLTALGAEVVWTRMLALMLGGTVYTFSIILAVFLLGLGIGAAVASTLLRRATHARAALAACQLLLAAAIAWTAYLLTRSLPYWPMSEAIARNPWALFRTDLFRSAWALLPATCLWGASFPLALAAAPRERDAGRLVGRIFAANTVGAIVGAGIFTMVIIPAAGTRHAEQLLMLFSLVAGLMLVPLGSSKGLSLGLATAASVVLLAWGVPDLPPLLVAYGRTLTTSGSPDIVYVGEGVNASIAVSELRNGDRNFHVGGKVEASTEPQDMRLQRMLANVPALLHPAPASVLVVGLGAGVTAGSFVPYPDVQRVVICEIEPLIPERVAPYFARENFGVVSNPRVQLVIDDARHFVLTTHEKFDIITSDPIHPWVKGAATLYTREYFELVKRHLKPGGIVTQWVPLYESNLDVVKSEIATFFDVFPNGMIWGNPNSGHGYDLVLSGQLDPLTIEVDALQRRLDRPDHRTVAASLQEVGFPSAIELLATYAGQASDVRPWLSDAQINRDGNLRLQYLAGLGLNAYQGSFIYDELLAYRRFPDERFVGSTAVKQQLLEAMGRLRAMP